MDTNFAQFTLVQSPVDSSWVVGYSYINGQNVMIRVPFPSITSIGTAVTRAEAAADTATAKAGAAAVSSGTSAAQANISITNAGIAVEARVGAEAAQMGAEIARDEAVQQVSAAQNAQTAGLVSLPDAASLSNLNFPDKTVVELADTGAHYVKSGASGAGSWTLSTAPTARSVAIVYSPKATDRSGWVGSTFDKFRRRLSGIELATNLRHHWLGHVFRDSVSVSGDFSPARVVAAGVRVTYRRFSVRSGDIWARFDVAGRKFLHQARDGSLWAWGKRLLNTDDYAALLAMIGTYASVTFGSTRITFRKWSPRSGYLWTLADKFGRLFFFQLVDGSVWAWGKRMLTTDDLVTKPLYAAYEAVDPAGNRQIYVRALATGAIRRASAAGSNNSDPAITSDGVYVTYLTDRSSGLGAGRIGAALAGGPERLVSPRVGRLTSAGDSLTYGQGATNIATEAYPAVLGAALGWTVTNRGQPGFTSSGVGALLGAIPVYVTLSGNSLLGNGATTTVTAIDAKPLSAHNGVYGGDAATRTITGTLVGVHGTLRRVASGTAGSYVDAYTFVSDAGTATTACPAGSVFAPDAPDQENEILSLCVGTNDPGYAGMTSAQTYANVDLIIAWAKPIYPKILLHGLPAASIFNSYWRSRYTQYYTVDALGRDLHERLLASGDGSTGDNADIAAGLIPRSLRSDSLHLNTAGYAIWATFAREVAQLRGYHL